VSKKKRKSYDDGVLVVRNNQCTLLSAAGQVLGKTAMYSTKTLSDLNVGHTLICGGRELEITGMISAEDYLSGRVFVNGISSSSSSTLSSTSTPLSSSTNVSISPALAHSLHHYTTLSHSSHLSLSSTIQISIPQDAVVLHPVESHRDSVNSRFVPVFLDPLLARYNSDKQHQHHQYIRNN
jgi:hypothetical protein